MKRFKVKNKYKGFTIVELLIVVVVIGILASIVTVAYTGITARANDEHRVSDVEVVKKFLAVYYIKNGHYIKSDRFLDANATAALSTGPLKGLAPGALRGPSASTSTVSSWGQWGGNVITGGMDYSIKSFTSTNANCIGVSYDDSDCTRFEIYYKTEENGSYATFSS